VKERSDDDAAFLEAMEGVRPLERSQHPPQPRYFEPVKLSERELEVIRALDALVGGAGPFDLRESDEVMEGCVPGLDPRVLRRLRRGEFTIQGDLDLHGCDAATARVMVEEFLVESHARGLRCVRIVHGRGNRSPNGEAVLKPSLPRWLVRGPARMIVLAWTAARPTDGGAGASYVLLRKGPGRKPRPSPAGS
jgi:DNA-nicking Smr family endonuclease